MIEKLRICLRSVMIRLLWPLSYGPRRPKSPRLGLRHGPTLLPLQAEKGRAELAGPAALLSADRTPRYKPERQPQRTHSVNVIGIDLGTTNSVAAAWTEGGPEL